MENLDKSYQESLDFIYSFIDFSMKRHLDDSHRFFKLDRMRRMMDLLGSPQDNFLSIHVAGTKGKGSTASLCASGLRAAGYKTGLYTSPHLQEFTERIQIDGEDFHLDLLFYNRKLRRLVAVELKVGEFKAAYKGQMELYLRWLDKHEREPEEASPLGIILCTGKKSEQIELLELDKSGIHVAEYLTALPPRGVLVERLQQATQRAQLQIEQRKTDNE